MERWFDKNEDTIIKIVIAVFLGFGVGFAMNHEWLRAIESISICVLQFFIYRWGKKLDGHKGEEDKE
ncbi:hypothetical protein GCM10008018_45400 [Paenibacillus marchantiophytorum]|uniref:Serine kinase n=1 Tax=Paenibacillus marchantiophytorum TaxID=1619310 RepID=A0ABQ1EZM3_9BACL|nr:hypothetical protein [Paenibacillus marchantiophytorum]GFZ93874.1 hypothetical protein GCM10008018_45400 [Paenibacillus marchantiophytorum]